MRARPGIDNVELYKRNMNNNDSNLYINRSLKESYETQACKPLPLILQEPENFEYLKELDLMNL